MARPCQRIPNWEAEREALRHGMWLCLRKETSDAGLARRYNEAGRPDPGVIRRCDS
jgi:hypothetical protein